MLTANRALCCIRIPGRYMPLSALVLQDLKPRLSQTSALRVECTWASMVQSSMVQGSLNHCACGRPISATHCAHACLMVHGKGERHVTSVSCVIQKRGNTSYLTTFSLVTTMICILNKSPCWIAQN